VCVCTCLYICVCVHTHMCMQWTMKRHWHNGSKLRIQDMDNSSEELLARSDFLYQDISPICISVWGKKYLKQST